MTNAEKFSNVRLVIVPRSARRMVLNPMRHQNRKQKPRDPQKLAQWVVSQHAGLANVKGYPHQKRLRRRWLKLNNHSNNNNTINLIHTSHLAQSRFWDEILLTLDNFLQEFIDFIINFRKICKPIFMIIKISCFHF